MVNKKSNIVIIREKKKFFLPDFSNIFSYKFMILNLIKRNIADFYAYQKFNYFWTIFRPLIYLFVAIFIKHVSSAKVTDDLPYPIFVYLGLISWWFFGEGSRAVARSVHKDKAIISKVYFPRIISPICGSFLSLFDFLLRLTILPIFWIIFNVYPTHTFFLIILGIFICLILSIGVGLIVTSISVNFRDAEKALAHLIHVGLFLSPIWYSFDILPNEYRFYAYILNPMASVIEFFRSLLTGNSFEHLNYFYISCFSSLFLLFIGLLMFARIEGRLADR